MLLKHNKLIIRNATVEDAEQLALWWNDGKIMTHAGFPNGTGQTAREIAESLIHDTDISRRRFIIEIDNCAVGEMIYRSKGSDIAEIRIKICDFSKQNRGNGKIFLSMLIYLLFHELGFKKIILDTNTKNERARSFMSNLVLENFESTKIHGQTKLASFNPRLIMNYTKRIFTTSQNEIVCK